MLGGADRGRLPVGRWLSVVAGVSILGWAVPALLMLRKGFAIEDEGSYVLSYRNWQGRPYFVSGSQYVYGPLFHALGESIPALRLLRLVMVVAANLWFAHAFLGWLGRRGGQLPASPIALTLLMVAAGGMSYLWTPLTPGYYDLTADCCLVLVALLLATLARGGPPPFWVPIATGVVGVALLITKWTAFPALVLLVGVAAYAMVWVSRKVLYQYVGLLVVGFAVALAACQFALVSIGEFGSTMWNVSSLTSVGNHATSYLLAANLRDTFTALVGAILLGLPLLIGLFVARMQQGRGHPAAARGWLLGAAAATALVLPFALGWHGGDDRGRVVISIALAGLLMAFLAAVLPGRRAWLPNDATGRLVGLVLLLVPFAQAAGTNVPLLYVAFECLAMWVALVLLATDRFDRSSYTTTAVLADLGVVVVATAMICGTTTLATPFKTSGFSHATTRVPQLGLDVSPTDARQDAALARALRPYVRPGWTPVFAMDQNAGLTYLTRGVPAGSTWNEADSPTRTAGILALACRNGDVAGAPVLLLSRPVDRDLKSALRGCGFDYPESYRHLPVPGGPPDLTVFVPRPSS